MANYTTTTDVAKLLTMVTASDIQTIHLDSADAVINAKVGTRYTVPFTTIPPIIAQIARDLSAYFVMRQFFTQDSQNKSEWVESYKANLKLLDEIAEGKINVLDATGVEVARITSAISSTTKDYTPTFDVDEIENSQVSQSHLDDVADDRSNDE